MRHAAAVLMTVLLVGTTGCTDARDLAVPDDVCGVTVGADRLAPFLPSGDKVEQDSYNAFDGDPKSPRCRVSVDKRLAVYISGDIVSTDTDPIEVQKRSQKPRRPNLVPASIGDEAGIEDDWAIAVARCTYEGKPHKFTTMVEVLEDTPEKTPERRTALENFLRAYFPKAMEKIGCQAD